MANKSSSSVWELIHSLTVLEKKTYTIYVKGLGDDKSATYKLYLAYQKMDTFDEEIEKNIAIKLKIKHLSNAKNVIWDRLLKVITDCTSNSTEKQVYTTSQYLALINKCVEVDSLSLFQKAQKEIEEFKKVGHEPLQILHTLLNSAEIYAINHISAFKILEYFNLAIPIQKASVDISKEYTKALEVILLVNELNELHIIRKQCSAKQEKQVLLLASQKQKWVSTDIVILGALAVIFAQKLQEQVVQTIVHKLDFYLIQNKNISYEKFIYYNLACLLCNINILHRCNNTILVKQYEVLLVTMINKLEQIYPNDLININLNLLQALLIYDKAIYLNMANEYLYKNLQNLSTNSVHFIQITNRINYINGGFK